MAPDTTLASQTTYRENHTVSHCFRFVLVAFLLVLMTPLPSSMGADGAATRPQVTVTFAALGDIPYSREEERMLVEQIAATNADPSLLFVIHVGDIKRGRDPCREEAYAKVAKTLAASTHPLFIIPGDNEWNECWSIGPKKAWALWSKHFLRFEDRQPHQLSVARQEARPENFAFFSGGALFVGLNLVGGLVHHRDEWRQRMTQDADWLDQQIEAHRAEITHLVVFGHSGPGRKDGATNPFFDRLEQAAVTLKKPVLYLHGDGHTWVYDHPFRTARNILRVQVDQGGKAPPVRVKVMTSPVQPFVLERDAYRVAPAKAAG